MRNLIVVAALLIVAVMGISATSAHARTTLIDCRGTSDYVVHDLITNQWTGCGLARRYAVSFQKASFAGQITDSKRLVYRTKYLTIRFRLATRTYYGDHDPVTRIQSFGIGSPYFVSFETDQ